MKAFRKSPKIRMEYNMSRFAKQCNGSEIERMSSSDEEREAQAMGSACASRARLSCCVELLSELNHLLGGVLTNAQAMQWKLPAYSHSKRYLREIERSAQRGGSLVKQLLRHLHASGGSDDEFCAESPSLAGAAVAVTAQEPEACEDPMANQPRSLLAHAAPDFSRARASRTHMVL
jgi:hypothetical protein